MHDTTAIYRVATRYNLSFDSLAPIILEYIKTDSVSIFVIKMAHLCGHYAPFVERELAATINESKDFYYSFPHVIDVRLTPHRLIIDYKDICDETS